MNVKERICRCCVGVAENENLIIDEVTKKIFCVLLLQMDLDFSKNPVLCKNCAEIIKNSFYFKLACIDTEKYVISFAMAKKEVKFDMRHVYGSKKIVKPVVDRNYSICRLCMNLSELSNCIWIDSLMNGTTFAEMLQIFLPEMDFTIIENSVICPQCKQSLERYFSLVFICSDTEKKINTYCRDGLSNNNGQKDLSHVPKHFSFKDGRCDENTICLGYKYVATSRKNPIKHMQTHLSGGRMYECVKCNFRSINWRYLKKHVITHKGVSELRMYKCTKCTYRTKNKLELSSHALAHACEINIFKCTECPFMTKYESSLQQHMPSHEIISFER